jgi:hypothetical protein
MGFLDVLDGLATRLGARSKKARRTREADEFPIGTLSSELNPPKRNSGAVAWSLPAIFAARDLQMSGRFREPARLAEAMRTDDAIFVAKSNRLAPEKSLEVEIVAASEASRAQSIANEAEALFGKDGLGLSADTLSDINGCLVDHGVAFGICTASPREDGSRVDISLHAWPIEFVRWDAVERTFKTQVEDGSEETIAHGDGRWVVFQKHEIEPWKQEAALLPAALVWARHAFALRDWAKASVAHGNAKVVGELPEGVPLQDAGGLSQEAAAFLELLKAIAGSEAPVGVRPAGSKTDFLVNGSTAWQVWNELVVNAEKAAARIYLGTDGTLGSQGGAPGVDISALFGVATTKIQSDLAAIERGIKSGLLEPWCAINFGDSSLAPTRKYVIPDPDEDAIRESFAKRNAALQSDIAAAKNNGLIVDQAYVNALAKEHGIDPPPRLPAPAGPAVQAPPTPP